MTPAATLGLYAGLLVLVLLAAFGLGRVVGPVGAGAAETTTSVHSGGAVHRTTTLTGALR